MTHTGDGRKLEKSFIQGGVQEIRKHKANYGFHRKNCFT